MMVAGWAKVGDGVCPWLVQQSCRQEAINKCSGNGCQDLLVSNTCSPLLCLGSPEAQRRLQPLGGCHMAGRLRVEGQRRALQRVSGGQHRPGVGAHILQPAIERVRVFCGEPLAGACRRAWMVTWQQQLSCPCPPAPVLLLLSGNMPHLTCGAAAVASSMPSLLHSMAQSATRLPLPSTRPRPARCGSSAARAAWGVRHVVHRQIDSH